MKIVNFGIIGRVHKPLIANPCFWKKKKKKYGPKSLNSFVSSFFLRFHWTRRAVNHDRVTQGLYTSLHVFFHGPVSGKRPGIRRVDGWRLPFRYFTCFSFIQEPNLLRVYFPTIPLTTWAGIATGYGLDDRGVGVRFLVGSRIFSSPRRPDRLWGPTNLLFNGYRGKSGRVVKLTTHLQLLPWLRKCGSIHPLAHTPWWHNA
jgi:hypothetical protein